MAVLPASVRELALPRVAAFILAICGTVALMYYGRLFLITLVTAVIVAFILEPVVQLLVRIRIPRPLASLIACILAAAMLYLAGFGLYTQGASLVEDLPKYRQKFSDLVDSVTEKIETAERAIYELLLPRRIAEQERAAQEQARKAAAESRTRRNRRAPEPVVQAGPQEPAPVPEVRIRPERPPVVEYIYSHLGSVYETLLMLSFVPFLVYFMLSWRNHIYRSFLLLFDDDTRVVATKTLDGIAAMVRAFVVGNFVLGIILASASSIAFTIIGLPYPLLIGPISGFLSLVPYVGLPLAFLPPFLGALAVATKITLYLVVAAIVGGLHLLALNLLYPKIVGQRVHLNPLVVTIAIMLWGTLWGAAGFLLAIPITAGIKAVCDNVAPLQPYGRFLGD